MNINWRRLGFWAVVLLVLFYVISRPQTAANFVDTAVTTLIGWGESIIQFITTVFTEVF